MRYADWANRTESFTIKITQSGRDVFSHEFGAKDVIDPHDEIKMYWQWAFAWDGATATLAKGPARVSIEIQKAAQASRQIDCFVLTNDGSYIPQERQKPEFAASGYLRDFAKARTALAPLIDQPAATTPPQSWNPPKVAGRDFVMPWNITKEFWSMYDKPADQRPLYLFHAEPIDEFVKAYSGKREVPIFDSKFVVPVIYINDAPELLKEGSSFRDIYETRSTLRFLSLRSGAFCRSDAQAAGHIERRVRDKFRLV